MWARSAAANCHHPSSEFEASVAARLRRSTPNQTSLLTLKARNPLFNTSSHSVSLTANRSHVGTRYRQVGHPQLRQLSVSKPRGLCVCVCWIQPAEGWKIQRGGRVKWQDQHWRGQKDGPHANNEESDREDVSWGLSIAVVVERNCSQSESQSWLTTQPLLDHAPFKQPHVHRRLERHPTGARYQLQRPGSSGPTLS